MARPKKSTKNTRKQYSEEYREEALALATQGGCER